MKLFVGIIIIVAIIFIVCVFMKKQTQDNDGREQETSKSQEFYKYYNSIDIMSYEQLDKIHSELLPLCNEITFVMLPHNADENGNPIWDSQEVTAQRLKQKREEILPAQQQIYGCNTYGDADELNRAIVKRLDELDEDKK